MSRPPATESRRRGPTLGAVELVICDCDGTLADSLFAITETFRLALAEVGWRAPVERAAVARYVGLPLARLFEELLPGAEAATRARLESAYRRRYPEVAAGRTPLFPGVREALGRLAARGLRLALATGKSRAGVDRFLAESGLAFEAIRCADTAAHPKPHPAMVEEILEETGVAPARALMVGDTPYDLEMAHAAGVASCGVASGGFTREELAACGPALLLDRFAQLPEALGGAG
ncbi:MAG: HAD family hydrolase [Nitrospirae bacterium]|nr:MAG: HAD family hydrolase [Nitrospirota bacterium]